MSYESILLEENFFHYLVRNNLVTGSEMLYVGDGCGMLRGFASYMVYYFYQRHLFSS